MPRAQRASAAASVEREEGAWGRTAPRSAGEGGGGWGLPRTWRATTATAPEEREEGAAARSGGRGVREGGRDGGRGGMRCAIEGEEMGGLRDALCCFCQAKMDVSGPSTI